MKRYAKGRAGRVRIRLARVLEEALGEPWRVNPTDIYANHLVGAARLHEDCATWDASAWLWRDGQQRAPRTLWSYDTMTACSGGVEVDADGQCHASHRKVSSATRKVSSGGMKA